MIKRLLPAIKIVVFFLISGELLSSQDLRVYQRTDQLIVENDLISLSFGSETGEKIVSLSYLSGSNHLGGISVGVQVSGDNLPVFSECKLDISEIGVVKVTVSYPQINNAPVKVNYSISANSGYLTVEHCGQQFSTILSTDIHALVIPDHIGEDIILYPSPKLKRLRLSEDAHYIAGMIGGGGAEAILSAAWSAPETQIHLEGGANSNDIQADMFNSLIITSAAGDSFIFGVTHTPRIWHIVSEPLEQLNGTAIDWLPPAEALWFVALQKETGFIHLEDGHNDIWRIPERTNNQNKVMVRQQGVVITKAETWQAWFSGGGNFTYPCYYNEEKTFLSLPNLRAQPRTKYNKSYKALIYPREAMPGQEQRLELPAEATKKFLGEVAWKQLRLERDKRGLGVPATCAVTREVETFFFREEAAQNRKRIAERLEAANFFVTIIRQRLTEYLNWQRRLDAYLLEESSKNPELKATIEIFRQNLGELELAYTDALEKIKTPQDCVALSNKILPLIDADISAGDKEDAVKSLGREIRSIGGGQDDLAGKFRAMVKAVRRNAALRMLTVQDLKEYHLLSKIREETAAILRVCFHHEGK